MEILQDISLLRGKDEIILYGVNKTKLTLLHENGIFPVCFCDDTKKLQGTLEDGLMIYSLKEVSKKFQNPTFLVISSFEAISRMEELGHTECYLRDFVYQSLEGKVSLLTKLVMEKIEFRKYEQKNSAFLYARNIDIPVTDKCSLRCKDCSNLMPFYENPVDFKKEEVYKMIDEISDIFDKITEIHLLGGEPFVHRDIYDIIEYASQKENVTSVTLFTNGTIPLIPERIACLDPEKVVFAFTKYGDLSRNLEKNTGILDQYHICYSIFFADTWMDCINFEKQNYSETTLKQVYKICCTKNTNTFLNGKLYICSYGASLHRLKAAPEEAFDFVEISKNSKDLPQLKKEISNYLYERDYIETCRFCTGRDPVNGKKVKAAIQAATKLPYEKFS